MDVQSRGNKKKSGRVGVGGGVRAYKSFKILKIT